MSKKNLASTRKHLLSNCCFLAIPLLTFGFVPGVLAQPADNTWDTTISFSGSGGDLNMSLGAWAVAGVPDPLVSVSLSGTGVTTANAIPGSPYYDVESSFSGLTANVTIPDSYGPTVPPFSVALTGLPSPLYVIPGSSGPFYNLFPPSSGTEYTGLAANDAAHFYYYAGTKFYVQFDGIADLTIGLPGDTPTLVQSGDSYAYSYSDSVLALTATNAYNDPVEEVVDFTGTVVITTTAAVPDSSPGLAGVLALLAVCGGGAWQKAREA
jgi:hypothetical protein